MVRPGPPEYLSGRAWAEGPARRVSPARPEVCPCRARHASIGPSRVRARARSGRAACLDMYTAPARCGLGAAARVRKRCDRPGTGTRLPSRIQEPIKPRPHEAVHVTPQNSLLRGPSRSARHGARKSSLHCTLHVTDQPPPTPPPLAAGARTHPASTRCRDGRGGVEEFELVAYRLQKTRRLDRFTSISFVPHRVLLYTRGRALDPCL